MNFDFKNLGLEELLEKQKEVQQATEIAIVEAIEQSKKQGANLEVLEELTSKVEYLTKVVNDLRNQEQKIKKIQINKFEPVQVDNQHENFEKLLISISCGLNVMLVGEAGSGKTSGAHEVAKILEKDFYSISVGAQTGKHEFFGFKNANGDFIETDFYNAYKNGGLFLIDELDAGNAGVLTSINSALANGCCSFACGMVDKHENFICVATANTYGNGATMDFVGRNQLDGATLDRFVFLDWNIDKTFEIDVCQDTKNCLEIQKIRATIKKLNIRHIVSTRAVLNSEKLLAAGMDKETVYKMTVWKGLDENTVNQIKNNL